MNQLMKVIFILLVLGCSLIPITAVCSDWSDLKFKSKKGNFKAEINGAVMADYIHYSNAPEKFESGAEVQSLQLSLKLRLAKAVKFKFKYDYSEDEPELKDCALGFLIGDLAELTIGQFEQPSSLDGVTSSKEITFMTRAAPIESFLPGRSQGVNLGIYGDWMVLQFGSYIEYEKDDEDVKLHDHINYSFRNYVFSADEKGGAFHLGIWGIYGDPVENKYKLEVEPEAKINAKEILKSGKVKHVNHVTTAGFETGLIYGPLTAQAEYIHQDYSRFTGYDEFYYNGYYCSFSLMLTGEAKSYSQKDGAIKSPKPMGEYGAFEIAVRSSNVDMTHYNRDRGEMDSYTLGINWYLNEGFRMMYNYTQTESTELREPMKYSQVRLQYAF